SDGGFRRVVTKLGSWSDRYLSRSTILCDRRPIVLNTVVRLRARARQYFWRTSATSGVVATTLLLVACAPQSTPATNSPPPAPAVAVSVAPARQGPIQQSLTYSGDLVAARQITVLPKMSGQIQDLPVGLGSPVKAGDVLVTLDPRTAQTQVEQAQAGLI